MRVVSLLPSATETLCRLGGSTMLAGRSHECDFSVEVQSLPGRTTPAAEFTTPAEVDARVRESLSRGESLYRLDEAFLADLRPDVILCVLCGLLIFFSAAPVQAQPGIEHIASATLEPSSAAGDRPLGGISGLTWDAATHTWLAVSDDKRSPHAYRIAVELIENNGAMTLSAGVVETIPLVCDARDAEAIAPAPDGGWFVGFESPPTIFHFKSDFANPVELPDARRAAVGLQRNKSWESIALLPGEKPELLAISELGPASTREDPKRFRRAVAILLDPKTGHRIARGVYRLPPPPGLGAMGVSELEPVAPDKFLLLRRSRTIRKGYDAAIDVVDMTGNKGALMFTSTRLGSLRELGVKNRGNVEAMALGPKLDDGSRLLLLMSDDNFGADGQTSTQLIALRYTSMPE